MTLLVAGNAKSNHVKKVRPVVSEVMMVVAGRCTTVEAREGSDRGKSAPPDGQSDRIRTPLLCLIRRGHELAFSANLDPSAGDARGRQPIPPIAIPIKLIFQLPKFAPRAVLQSIVPASPILIERQAHAVGGNLENSQF